MNIVSILLSAVQIYTWILIIYIFMSWIPNARESSIGRMIASIAEPYLAPFRKIIPPIGGMLDISPIVAIFALQFVQYGIIAVFRFIG
ncbi:MULTISPECIES: YggT family protein [Bacillales]|uniref:YggT family protein n=1 Tax=Bacillales TaxID=1385 RepID=UPI0018840717|nr:MULTISPECIES: YggT family protein [Bacillaceae]MBF0708369.1 YggT family protein [Pseudalkalibacillus hwajinpoensis]MDO6655559.1 YggT family protein [Anaerobacillus sp. 1_MG-2023]WLR59685.1 YggT family protein [Pseudalkalibacillus hwajinpoensis]